MSATPTIPQSNLILISKGATYNTFALYSKSIKMSPTSLTAIKKIFKKICVRRIARKKTSSIKLFTLKTTCSTCWKLKKSVADLDLSV